MVAVAILHALNDQAIAVVCGVAHATVLYYCAAEQATADAALTPEWVPRAT